MSRVLTFVARRQARDVATRANGDRSAESPGAQFAVACAAPVPETCTRGDAIEAPDYTVENKGTLLLLRSTSPHAYDWLVAHTDPAAHWFGRALVIEHGYIDDFVAQLRVDGFTVDEKLA